MVMATGLAHRVGEHHPIPTEIGAKAAASAYRKLLREATPFDMVLLGMGEDGHTASLFPSLAGQDRVCGQDSPKNHPNASPLASARCRTAAPCWSW